MSYHEAMVRIVSSFVGTGILAGLIALAYGVDWMAMLYGDLPR